jgi:hypothetical protein
MVKLGWGELLNDKHKDLLKSFSDWEDVDSEQQHLCVWQENGIAQELWSDRLVLFETEDKWMLPDGNHEDRFDLWMCISQDQVLFMKFSVSQVC